MFQLNIDFCKINKNFFNEIIKILNKINNHKILYKNNVLYNDEIITYAFLKVLIKYKNLKITEDLFDKQFKFKLKITVKREEKKLLEESIIKFYNKVVDYDLDTNIEDRNKIYKILINENSFCYNILNDISQNNVIEPLLSKNFFIEYENNNFKNSFNQNQQVKDVLNKSYLQKYGINLTKEKFLTDPAVGRENELKELMISLLTNEKSVIIIGDAGVGKTAIVEGFAYMINNDLVPQYFAGKKIIKLNVSSIVEGSRYLGTFEEKLQNILDELLKNDNVILFIDEVHLIVGAGATEKSNVDIANILKPFLDRGKIKIIGATTYNEYKKYIEKDEAIKRRFEPVFVKEIGEETLKIILNSAIEKYEEQTNVVFDFSDYNKMQIIDIICKITNKSNRNKNDFINNPDLALTLLSKAFAYAALEGSSSLKIAHIILAINSSYRIVEIYKNKYISMLNYIKEENNIVQFARKNCRQEKK